MKSRDSSTPTGRRPARERKVDPAYGSDLDAGTLVGNYRVEGRHSRGGFATIYRAVHSTMGRLAALKVLHKYLSGSAPMVRRFMQEGQAVNLVRHPNIVDIFEFGQLPDHRPFFVMEWLEGSNLAEHLQAHGPMAEADAVSVVEDLCAGLAAAHDVGVIHRDLKSSNVVLVPAGSWYHVKLVDFGIAKLLSGGSPDLSALGSRLGTPLYMAPEQILNRPVDARTDVYAVGVLLYEMLTGELPFSGNTPEELEHNHLHAPPPSVTTRASVSPGLDALIRHCLQKESYDRPQTVAELVRELRRAVTNTRPPRGALRSGPAIGLRVEARLDGAAPIDERAIDALGRVLAETRLVCQRVGLELALDSANSILGAAPLPIAHEDSLALKRRVLVAATDLRARLSLELGVRAALSVHVASLIARVGDHPVQYLGGDLLCLGDWAAGHPADDLIVTTAALDGLDAEFVHEPIAGRPALLRLVAASA